jgi:hypothetical protein
MSQASVRRVISGVTFATWLGVCALVFWQLMRRAAEAPPGTIEEYARAPSFQVLNFMVGHLPGLVVVLIVLFGVEHVALRAMERRRDRAR